jgi:transcriptional regulator with XRE-family HTH domain
MQFTFSEQVKILMDRKNMSISALADALGVSRQNLSKRLKNNNFDIAWMQNIAQELGTAVTITLNELQGSINAQSLVYEQATAISQAPQTAIKPARKKPGPKPDPNKKKKLTKAEEYEKLWKTDKYGISYFNMPNVGWVPAERTSNGFNGLDLDEVAKTKADYEKNEWPLVKKISPQDYESLRIDGFLPVPDECLLPPDDQHDWQIIPKPDDFLGRRSWLCDDGKTYAIDIPIKRF